MTRRRYSRTFIEQTLGFTPAAVEKGNGLWSERAWPLICAALAEHVLSACEISTTTRSA